VFAPAQPHQALVYHFTSHAKVIEMLKVPLMSYTSMRHVVACIQQQQQQQQQQLSVTACFSRHKIAQADFNKLPLCVVTLQQSPAQVQWRQLSY
jgi:hypothetical protein